MIIYLIILVYISINVSVGSMILQEFHVLNVIAQIMFFLIVDYCRFYKCARFQMAMKLWLYFHPVFSRYMLVFLYVLECTDALWHCSGIGFRSLLCRALSFIMWLFNLSLAREPLAYLGHFIAHRHKIVTITIPDFNV